MRFNLFVITCFLFLNIFTVNINPLFSQNDCSIYDVSAEVIACEGDLFDVSINFEFENTSDSFKIQGNGLYYGNFSYNDVPVTLTGLAADCETDYEFVVIDLEYADCSDFTELGTVCCEGDCALSDLTLTPGDCNNDNQHTLTINFNYENPGNDFFDLWINNEYQGYYLLNELPLTITLSGTDNQFDHVLICINDNSNCCIDGNNENPCYNSENCNIWDVSAEVIACEGDLFDVSINFEFENTSDSFKIQGNGVYYGNFSYNDVPVTLTGLAADCETDYEFVVIDLEYAYCSDFTELGTICCEGDCALSDLTLTPGDCNNDNQHTLTINFNYENPGNDFFDLWINNVYQGYYLLNDLPVSVTLSGTDNQFDHVLICINDNSNCCIDGNNENPCYNSENCNIWDVSTDVTACEGDLFDVSINFEFENTSDSFKIQGNGVIYGNFSYNDVPVTLTGLAADCETQYEFVITDVENSDCSGFTELGTVCCEGDCLIDNIAFGEILCSGDFFAVYINFEYEYTSDSFNIIVNEENHGNYSYNDLPVLVFPFVADGVTEYIFEITDLENEDCSETYNLGTVSCGTTSVNDQNLQDIEIINDQSGFLLNFNDVMFDKADILVVNDLGQMISKKMISNHNQINKYHLDLHYNGVFFVKIVLKYQNKDITISKKSIRFSH